MTGGTSAAGGTSGAGARLGAELAPVERGCEGRLAVAARALGGRGAVRWGDGLFVAASVMKVNILAALLLLARTRGRAVTGEERALAAAMIERSDNASASALWTAIGGAEGVEAANRRLGPRRTEPDLAGRWGLSRTTADDQLALLDSVYGEVSPLEPEARAYVRELMGRVVDTQRWGVSAAGDGTAGPELKNGWLPRTATGLWVVHSVGRVTAGGHAYLLAVLSDGHSTWERGIETVEEAARAAVRALHPRPSAAALKGSPSARTVAPFPVSGRCPGPSDGPRDPADSGK